MSLHIVLEHLKRCHIMATEQAVVAKDFVIRMGLEKLHPVLLGQ